VSKDIGGAFIALVILGTLVVHLYYAAVAIYRRRWQFAAKVGGFFALYLLAIVLSFFLAVGLCAAGCPRDLEFLLGLLYLGLSVGLVLRLRKSQQRLVDSAIPKDST
jgi:hypothetical protein